jgi:hypothetical protein
MTEPLKILSMGWGVQTWTLAAMMALDEIPRADFIIHADTGHEREATYDFARRWTPWLGEHGLSVITVSGGRTDVVEHAEVPSVMIPAFTTDRGTGKHGQIRRQCTHDWKIRPIRRWIREELERRGQRPTAGVVESWQGISVDEFMRMRDSDVKWITNVYPLVDRRISRAGCVAWLEEHGLELAPRSSCTFCPYRSLASWKNLKRYGGSDWEEAVAVDETIRTKRPKCDLFVHPARKPLPEAVTIPEDFGAVQLEMPCDSGYCFT